MTEQESVILLNAIPGLGSVRIRRLVEHFGSACKVVKAKEPQLTDSEILPANVIRKIFEFDRDNFLQSEYNLLQRYGVKAVTIFEENYPAQLATIHDPPVGIDAALNIENAIFLEAKTKRMEEEGLEDRRLALDHVASSMAHEIDNPMGVISGQVETLQILFQDARIVMSNDIRQRLNKSFNFILEASGRVTGMIRAIQEYSKKTTGELKPIKIQEVEDGFWRLMSHAYKDPSIKFIKQIESDLPYILADKIQLEEILVNFSNNALHAVRNVEEKKIMFKIFKKNEDWIRIEFSDTGYGIPKAIISDIFLASVTTKGSPFVSSSRRG